MMYDNHATPYYYGKFREKVLSGNLPVCETISMEMARIDALIDDPKYYYCREPVEGFINYCKSELTLPDGSAIDDITDEFKLWGEALYGWYYKEIEDVYVPDEHGGHYEQRSQFKRLTLKQFIIVARAVGKTLYDSFVNSYELNVNPIATQQIVTAPTMRQANEMLVPITVSIAIARGPLFKFLTRGSLQNTTGDFKNRKQLFSSKEGIKNTLLASKLEICPMSINKLQGFHPNVATIDEWLSGDTRENPIEALEQGAAKNDPYIILCSSSEGTVRNGIGDSIKMELMKILKGEFQSPETSIFWYKLDDIKEVGDPRMWVKACPAIGKTVKYETYQRDVAKAEANPSARNDILAKRFGLPMEGFTYFFTYEETLPVYGDTELNFDGMLCSMGADMSLGDDFCTYLWLFPIGGGRNGYGIKTRCYITEKTLYSLPIANRYKYEDFIEEKSLLIMPGTVLNMDQVYEDVDAYITKHEYEPICFGYDPYNAEKFVKRWKSEYGEYGTEVVRQGVITESVPIGEIKKLAEDALLLFDQGIMTYTMGNAMVQMDSNGNQKLFKARRESKIDCVSALIDSWVVYKNYRDEFE